MINPNGPSIEEVEEMKDALADQQAAEQQATEPFRPNEVVEYNGIAWLVWADQDSRVLVYQLTGRVTVFPRAWLKKVASVPAAQDNPRQATLKEVITRLMARCGPLDSWKKNEKPDLSSVIIELSNLLDEPFTTGEAIRVSRRIGVPL
jgi:hypothetical protein